jgi:hypothetical protein
MFWGSPIVISNERSEEKSYKSEKWTMHIV